MISQRPHRWGRVFFFVALPSFPSPSSHRQRCPGKVIGEELYGRPHETTAVRAAEVWTFTCITDVVMSISTMAIEESELIRRILGGQRDLFGDLIAPHLTPLLRALRATIGGYVELEDIVQQTVLKAFSHLEQFRFEASFRTWLIRIGLNEARAWRRKSASSRVLALDPAVLSQLTVADERLSPRVEYERHEAGVRLHAALARLPEKYRAVILLRDFYGFTLSEVGGRLGLTIPAVKTRQMLARQKIGWFLRPMSETQPRSRACR